MFLNVKHGEGSFMNSYDTNPHRGLSTREIPLKRKLFGENTIEGTKRISGLSIFLEQFKDFITLVLIAATFISFLLGEVADAIAISAIVLLNSLMGFIQEYNTEKSLKALKELAAPKAKVVRDGNIMHISAKEVVPGDIVILEAGDKVPADGRIIEAQNINIDESILTGESVPVEKNIELKKTSDIKIHNKNLAFMGTLVVSGRGKMVVESIGMDTEMGKIAGMIDDIVDEETPLQKRLDTLGKQLVAISLALCALVSFLGVLRGENAYDMFLLGVSLAVAAIPEGLPAIVTVVLTLGVQRMIKKNVVIRRLPAVETLGCATVICSDKTGTLTENKMSVRKIYQKGKTFTVTGTGYRLEGEFITPEGKIEQHLPNELKHLLRIAVSCNNASIVEKTGFLKKIKRTKEMTITGDPTEAALLLAGLKGGLDKSEIDSEYIRLKEYPFNSEEKRMSVIVQSPKGELFLFVKGALDSILSLCNKIDNGGEIERLTKKDSDEITKTNEDMGREALRVLAFAYKKLSIKEMGKKEIYKNLIFSGMMGMIDPPRPEAKEAMEKCFYSGIRPIMITGDHRATAWAIASELGMFKKGGKIFTGKELDKMGEQELLQNIDDATVFARVTPKHKLRIVKALKKKGHIVAMTGDGVNDAPAIKEADIGVAMGIGGTEVTKEASSIILMDDNFASIVSAIEEGRIIYDNIRKFIRYLLSCNIGEVLTMVWTSLLGLPVPLLPIQILWVNLVTDGLPAIALGVDPAEKDVMLRKPRKRNESIFSQGLGLKIIYRGICISIATLIAYILSIYYSGDLATARTSALSTLVTAQLMFVFECRTEKSIKFGQNPFSNLYLTAAVMVSMIMLLVVIYVPFLQPVFKTVPIDRKMWLLIIALAGLSAVI